MKKILITGVALCGLTVAGLTGLNAHAMDMKAASGKKVVLVGEVLDMDCFMNEGAHGKKHQDCAIMCLNNGAPVGLLTDDGTAYFLTANEEKGKTKFYDHVREWGGQRATITGVVQDRAGAHSVRVDDAEQVK